MLSNVVLRCPVYCPVLPLLSSIWASLAISTTSPCKASHRRPLSPLSLALAWQDNRPERPCSLCLLITTWQIAAQSGQPPWRLPPLHPTSSPVHHLHHFYCRNMLISFPGCWDSNPTIDRCGINLLPEFRKQTITVKGSHTLPELLFVTLNNCTDCRLDLSSWHQRIVPQTFLNNKA